MESARSKDILLLLFAIQFSIIGLEPADWSLVPLFFVGVLLTLIVMVREIGRRLTEYANR